MKSALPLPLALLLLSCLVLLTYFLWVSPVHAPSQTIDVEATVTARLEEERAILPNPAPEPQPPGEATATIRLLPSVVRLVGEGSTGSGIVVGDGFILTNWHVVGDAKQFTVESYDGQEGSALVVALEEPLDVALLRYSDLSLPSATLADPHRLTPGEPVLAIGYPLNLAGGPTITRGVFCAVRVGSPVAGEWVQSDVAVNPGNSGGALANLQGEVIGLVSQQMVPEGQMQGIAFSLSGNSMGELLPALRLAAGSLPSDAEPASADVTSEVGDFLKGYCQAEELALAIGDPLPLRGLSSPAFLSRISAYIRELKRLGLRDSSELLGFRLQAVYSLPNDLVMAEVVERWHNQISMGEKTVADRGNREYPKIPVLRRVSSGWQVVAVQYRSQSQAIPLDPTPSGNRGRTVLGGTRDAPRSSEGGGERRLR